MKTLTVRQPWAILIAAGDKRIETRRWYTTYRGPLAIHASKRFPGWARDLLWEEPFGSTLARLIGYGGMFGASSPLFEVLPLGRVIAVCQLVDCYQITADNAPPEPERSFGDYTPGRWAWVLEDVKLLPQPWPQAKGRQGLWEWAPDG